MLMRLVVTLLVDDSLLAGLELEHIKVLFIDCLSKFIVGFGFSGGFKNSSFLKSEASLALCMFCYVLFLFWLYFGFFPFLFKN